MKERVIKYLTLDKSWDGGVLLYNMLPGKSLAYARQLNHLTNSTSNLANLHYELGRLVGLTEGQVKNYLKPRKASVTKVNPVTPSNGMLEYQELKKKVAELKLDVPNQKKATLIEALIKYEESLLGNEEESTSETKATGDGNSEESKENSEASQEPGKE